MSECVQIRKYEKLGTCSRNVLSIKIIISDLMPDCYLVELNNFFWVCYNKDIYLLQTLNWIFSSSTSQYYFAFERLELSYFYDINICITSPFILMDTFLVSWAHQQFNVFFETCSEHCSSPAYQIFCCCSFVGTFTVFFILFILKMVQI